MMPQDSIASDTARISLEYERRDREIPEGYYSWSRPGNLLMHEQVLRNSIALLSRAGLFPLRDRKAADIGCGFGGWLLEFMEWGADPTNLGGVDLMPDRVAFARHRIPGADLHEGSASRLPWPGECFDLVSQFLVFSNMFDPALKRAAAAEMLRILKPGGGILWFDLRVNNPRNPQIRGIREAEIRSLFPGCSIELRPTVLAPPLSRTIAKWSWPLATAMGSIPFLCSHYVGLVRKPSRAR
jgi:ubiquinone/menaquinone biosynthesis C-methylase UbiE